MRRKAMVALILLAAISGGPLAATAQERPSDLPEVTLYKGELCPCCDKWADHLTEAGFKVNVITVGNLAARKAALGVPSDLGSCHTAIIDGYVVEGHVPASTVERLVTERPGIHGIAVPGMPIGSPGMEGPNPESYEVIAFGHDGKRSVFARH